VTGSIRIEADKILQETHCLKCDNRWNDIYVLVDVVPNEKEQDKNKDEMLNEIVDSALLTGTTDVECRICGLSIHCEIYAFIAWCENCTKYVPINNPLVVLGFL
jgi:hypothetical protein